ncbi:MAG: hypothetical protein HQ580_09300 [Planctomycetes bacterium]|nr:hypothetical protein [Planctomycetota bacterium]
MNKDLDIRAYKEAKVYLFENTPLEVTEEIIEYYLNTTNVPGEYVTLNKIYFQLLSSAQSANMKPGVIGGSIGGIDKLGSVLFDFSPTEVLNEFNNKPEYLLDQIIEKVNPKGKVRRIQKSIWPKYCKTILSAAEFFVQFNNADEFFNWAKYFYEDKIFIAALPLILEAEIYGIAFPLACDFLKELGYVNFGKPDVHIIEQFKALGLVGIKSSNYQILKAITRIADHVGVSAYNVDKLFWLIGSGNFYDHRHIGKNGRVPRMKKAFIEHWLSIA